MARAQTTHLEVRSAFARERVRALCELTGMTASEVIEDALRGYVPPGTRAITGNLVRRGALLVDPGSNKAVNLKDANDALDRSRERDLGR